jgi:uncharacterized protein
LASDITLIELQRHHLYGGLEEGYCSGEALQIPGPVGPLEVVTSCPSCYNGQRPLAIICHPHPLFGGTMRNKVVRTLADTFNTMGLLSITFNFRGVEQSRGRFDHGRGESEDLLTIAGYFRKRYPHAPIWLAGFSFGAYVALRSQREISADRLLLVAPPVTLFDFTSLPEVEVPWLVIQGGKDEVIAPAAVGEWLRQRPRPPTIRWMADADHFFHGRLNRLRDTVIKQWQAAVSGGNNG